MAHPNISRVVLFVALLSTHHLVICWPTSSFFGASLPHSLGHRQRFVGPRVTPKAFLRSFTVSVQPVRDDEELRKASQFFVRAFWPEATESSREILERDQFLDWRRRYVSGKRVLNEGDLFVAKEFGRIVGTVSVSIGAFKNLGRGRYTGTGGLGRRYSQQDQVPVLANLAVAPAARRRGIGEKLCRQCELFATHLGYSEIFLAVDSANPRAARLYQKKLSYQPFFEECKASTIVANGDSVKTVGCINRVLYKSL